MAKFKRDILPSVLIVGEGHTDYAFLLFLRTVVIKDKPGVRFKFIPGHGGSPDVVVDFTIRQTKQAAYDKVFIVLDQDNPPIRGVKLDEVKHKARSEKIELIWVKPCIEGLFLSILEHKGKSWHLLTTKECQQVFDNEFKVHGCKTDPSTYGKIFKKNIIMEKQDKLIPLEKIIKFLQLSKADFPQTK